MKASKKSRRGRLGTIAAAFPSIIGFNNFVNDSSRSWSRVWMSLLCLWITYSSSTGSSIIPIILPVVRFLSHRQSPPLILFSLKLAPVASSLCSCISSRYCMPVPNLHRLCPGQKYLSGIIFWVSVIFWRITISLILTTCSKTLNVAC